MNEPIFEHGGTSERHFAHLLMNLTDYRLSRKIEDTSKAAKDYAALSPLFSQANAEVAFVYARELERRKLGL